MLRKLIAIILLCASSVAAADTAQRWFVGSYANVRAQAAKDAKIVDHLIANTPVTLLNTNADLCEISWGNNQHGFVACNLLGEQALNLDEIGTEKLPGEIGEKIFPNIQPNPKYSPPRAFWLEPTINRLFEAGEYFRKVMLPAKQLRAEKDYGDSLDSKPPELKRFPIPEFDAMKKLMLDGVVAPRVLFPTLSLPLATWKDLGTAIDLDTDIRSALSKDTSKKDSYYVYKAIGNEIYEQINLPAVKPSFFKSVDEIGRSQASAEELSAQYRIPHRMSVLNKPRFDDGEYHVLMGAWDIGEVTDRLTQPVYEIAIGIKGDVSVGETDAQTYAMRNVGSFLFPFGQGTTRGLLPGYKKITQPWIFFRLAQVPTLTKANVSVKKFTNVQKIVLSGNETKTQLTIARVDLDNDGVDDLLVWDNVTGECDFYRAIVHTRVILANVAGQWYLLEIENESNSKVCRNMN